MARTVQGAAAVRGAALVHARAHLGGAAARLSGARAWVWDVRSFWIDQRIDLGMVRRGSTTERVLRWMEQRVACSSTAVVTLSAAAIPALSALTGCDLAGKAQVVSTCVDLERFAATPMPEGPSVRLLMSGSLNALYDVPRMLEFHRQLRALRPCDLVWAGPRESPWIATLEAAGVSPYERAFADMPAEVAAADAGLCMLQGSPLSAVAAAPTKVAEFLACGRPVVLSRGIGDFDDLLAEYRSGVVVDSSDGEALLRAARELCELLEDPHLGERCRQLAEQHFDVERGVDRLLEVYARVAHGQR
jgi:glycosyltransferase involved in cell wall biosynthesis